MAIGCLLETAPMENRDVLCSLAVGGMAELHLVRMNPPGQPERLAVVKRLQRQLAADPDYVRMFLDEARIASLLHHPNVVKIYDIGDQADPYYIAMEHLHGHDLRRAMARVMERCAALPLDQALSIARCVADGLHYTHERVDADGARLDIVHRDVSPHNVLLTYDGTVKIVDFGIAKASTQRSRTRTGVLKGKVAYMSPEQASGQRVDRRSDVFSIGILLWEMTTGRWLYQYTTELETLNAVVHSRPPRPSRVVSRYPRDLEKIVMKALARAPSERWATAGELRDAIDELARRRRLSLGAEPVRALMATLFSDDVAAWQQAQSQGRSLGDHLAARADTLIAPDDDDLLPTPVFDSPRPHRLRQHGWLLLGGAVAVAAVVATWLAVNAQRETPRAHSTPSGANPANPASAVGPASPVAPLDPPKGGDPASPASSLDSPKAFAPAGAGNPASPTNPANRFAPAGAGNPGNPGNPASPAGSAKAVAPARLEHPVKLVRPAASSDPSARSPERPRAVSSPPAHKSERAPALGVQPAAAPEVAPAPPPRSTPPVKRPKPTNEELDRLP